MLFYRQGVPFRAHQEKKKIKSDTIIFKHIQLSHTKIHIILETLENNQNFLGHWYSFFFEKMGH